MATPTLGRWGLINSIFVGLFAFYPNLVINRTCTVQKKGPNSLLWTPDQGPSPNSQKLFSRFENSFAFPKIVFWNLGARHFTTGEEGPEKKLRDDLKKKCYPAGRGQEKIWNGTGWSSNHFFLNVD